MSTPSERMRAMNHRMKTDQALKAKNLAGQLAVRSRPEYRLRQGQAMKERMADPTLRDKAAMHCREINRDPEIRVRQWNGRRGALPPGKRELYRVLRRKVGGPEAMRLVWDEFIRERDRARRKP